ncbi:TPA: hypothetical protein R4341_000749 [Pasteurella multocida]|uniref:hypothetical protein n=1 Tax=Pasteurella multocida TaxID=747 RepID=UPI000D3D0120|nr:hypothetical protein [Pasteurella multocida]AWB55765.1 hypothetical protein pm9n_09295 [Pasteurella multocida]MEB3483824.1 hypothetical protein [Pasteurella multocida]MEB3495732.1 hypothetical protein [Pasteurella multocida]MEE3714902.1 hypothetical protein [Pasteurella multocida]TCH94358.1 hypothetical protein E0F65_07465 [Pasteurella multocida]
MKINLWNLIGAFLIALILGVSCHPAYTSEIDWEAQAKAEWIIEHGDNQVTLTEEAERYLRKQTMIIQEFYDARRKDSKN